MPLKPRKKVCKLKYDLRILHLRISVLQYCYSIKKGQKINELARKKHTRRESRKADHRTI